MVKNKPYIISIDIYQHDILVFFGNKELLINELEKYLEPDQIEEFDTCVQKGRGHTYMFDTGQLVLYMPNVPKRIDDFVTLNHEIFHCTILILKRIGVSLSDDSEEAYAYLYEYITKMIYSKTAKFSSSSSR
ncbi:hypothetical protein [Butyricimonas paravirosa]|nr:hypothetical protein [Butyricimonas paravirosa]